jgi:hypothetical protein
MMNFITALLLAAVLNLATALPILDINSASSQTITKRAVTCPATGVKQFLPVLRTMNDPNTDPNVFHVANGTATVSQVATFSDIPATASNFVLWWAQAAAPIDFTATGGGTVAVYALDNTKLPADATLTPEIVDAAVDASIGPFGTGRIGSGAFGGWPAVLTQQDHLVGLVNSTAKPQLSFRLTLQELGDVHLVEKDQNGWFLRYDC